MAEARPASSPTQELPVGNKLNPMCVSPETGMSLSGNSLWFYTNSKHAPVIFIPPILPLQITFLARIPRVEL
jgi:hypothetical protein